MITYVDGNILKVTNTKTDSNKYLLCHQVNCQGKMKSGIAGQISEKYPAAFKRYALKCEEYKDRKRSLLGKVQFIQIHDNLAVVNVFGQLNYGYDGRIYTNYLALDEAFRKISNIALEYGRVVAIPKNMGCGLGGGDWDTVHGLIEKCFDPRVNVVIVNYGNYVASMMNQ